MSDHAGVIIGLSAVIVSAAHSAAGYMPTVFTVRDAPQHELSDTADMLHNHDALPFGPFDPVHHRTLEIGLRAWVAEQTPFVPGYVDQLYTFGNKGRYAGQKEDGLRVVSVGYLALISGGDRQILAQNQGWRGWYDYFPLEDWRAGEPAALKDVIAPALQRWARAGESAAEKENRQTRINMCFGLGGAPWDEERVLERYELLYEARLLQESLRDKKLPMNDIVAHTGKPMLYDHRRILATAMGRLRGKLKYRPVVFEMMDETFTLFQLQQTVEAIAGQNLHKQNFRRLVEGSGLVEETGQTSISAPGRPAALFRFRRDVLTERSATGVLTNR